MKKIKEKFKNIFKDKKVKLITLGVLILIFLVLAICFIVRNNHKLTKLEEIKINEISDKYMSYMDDVEDTTSKDNDRYILYALDYSYYELDKDTLTTGELRKLINSIFNIDIKEQDLINIGITPVMNEKSIIYNSEKNTFSIIKDKKSYAQIASEKIVKY